MKIRRSYKEDTRLGHIQCERLPKSKMVSSDDRFMFEIVHVLQIYHYKSSTIARSLGKV